MGLEAAAMPVTYLTAHQCCTISVTCRLKIRCSFMEGWRRRNRRAAVPMGGVERVWATASAERPTSSVLRWNAHRPPRGGLR
ncbi:MAG: hypothetical protein CM15mP18_1930 [Methanobacteriota archaeon]|nr:MAG: hypothetical protein CM15mP18_1930 [Euryarchaeota archaeon]